MEIIRMGELEIARVEFSEGYTPRGDPPNAYILLGKPALVFDTGFQSEVNQRLFEHALYSCGLTLNDIGSVVLSHWHWDHTGLASWLASSTKAVFLVHGEELSRIAGTSSEVSAIARATENLYVMHGFASEIAAGITALAFEHQATGIPRSRISILSDEETILAGNIPLKVLHSPGHTPGSVCLYSDNNNFLLSADTLYGRLFPHPVAEIRSADNPDYSVLRDYPRTLDRLRKLAIQNCLPGHGVPFSPALKVMDTISRFMERRLDRMVRLLRESGSEMNAARILEVFFPRIGLEDLYHAAAEIILLLEVAEERGLVSRSRSSSNVLIFRAT